MDRQIVYAGSIPLETDLLNIQRNVQVAMGAFARALLGDGGLVDGMGIVPGGTPYSVIIGPGSYTVPAANDAFAFGSLAADATPVVQTGTLTSPATIQLAPPTDAGAVQCWLVQAALQVLDATPLALPYWNAGNPSVPFAGPGNSGVAQPTQRMLRVQVSTKAGVPQATGGGLPSPPEPDTGWVGLYSVLTYPGKPGIEMGDIAAFHRVPRLRFPLPAMPPGITRQEAHTTTVDWQAPDGVHWVRVRLVGGGGGGGGDVDYSGGGGGAGGYAEACVAVQPRQIYPVVIGPGGAGGSAVFTGSPGGTTSFGFGLVSATGGAGGASNNPDSHGGDPGTGTVGEVLLPGGYGGDGARLALVPAGNGGASAFGGGGRGSNEGGYPALGLAAGSGGGGGYGANSNGGNGAPGMVVIEW